MPARARKPQDPAAADTSAKRPSTRPPAAKPPKTKPPTGGQDDRAALEARVRVLEQTVNAVIATAAANQRAVGTLLRHLEEIAFERLVPPPPPPPPIKPPPIRPR